MPVADDPEAERPSMIPVGPAEVTPAWLTEVLRASGVLSGLRVVSLRAKNDARGWVGQVARFYLDYDTPKHQRDAPRTIAGASRPRSSPGPRSLVGKFLVAESVPRPNPMPHEARVAAHARELRFYTEVAPALPLRTPRLYYGVLDASTGRGVMLFEDLAPARAGDDVLGGSDADAICAVTHLARFHAALWDSTRLASLDWIASCDADANSAARLGGHWKLFVARFGNTLSSSFRHLVPRLVPALAGIRRQLARPPQTLLHGDFRLDNLFFGAPAVNDSADPPGSAKPDRSLTAIDWQAPVRGRGTWDLAYFAGWALRPDQRRRIEARLLHRYVAELAAHGVSGYSEQLCLVDYRLALLGTFPRIIAAGATVNILDSRVHALLESAIARYAAALSDHQLADLLD